MKYQFKTYPIDIVLFILWSIFLLPVVFLDIAEILRIVIGLPFLFFIPGYLLIFILFPTTNDYKGITGLERIGLSFGFSIAVVSLLGLLLNFTSWGIQLTSVLLTIFIITVLFGVVALYRWKTTTPDKRFTISIDTSDFKSSSDIEKFLTIFLILIIILALSSIVYIVVQPKNGEPFTDFYILTANGNVTNYPHDISHGQNISLLLGLINHEYKTMNYTLEVWLIDESVVFNNLTQKNETIYNHAWFMNGITVSLNPTEITNEKSQTKKWEYNYTFSINKIGHFKLAFLLFTSPSEVYDHEQDYKGSISLKIKTAYRELHLWFDVG
jgi:uncharacterized membrane protein